MKKIIALLLALVMVFALAACASKTEAPAEETKTETAATETATEEKTEQTTEEPAAETAAPADFKVGFIMLHDENSTYDLNFINAAKEAAEDLGVEYVITGHSERRTYFGDTNETVNKRTKAVVDAGMTAIVCVGEYLEQREQGVTDELVAMQVKIALGGIGHEQLDKVIIAYEPVWAIGTGKTATAEQAQEVCAVIRRTLAEIYCPECAEKVTVQYGGSMNAKNADELLSKVDVDGGLIGGASLKAPDFAAIVKSASK